MFVEKVNKSYEPPKLIEFNTDLKLDICSKALARKNAAACAGFCEKRSFFLDFLFRFLSRKNE